MCLSSNQSAPSLNDVIQEADERFSLCVEQVDAAMKSGGEIVHFIRSHVIVKRVYVIVVGIS